MGSIFSAAVVSYLEQIPREVLVVRCLIAGFVLSAILVSVSQLRRMRQQMHLLNEDTRARKAQDEERHNFDLLKPAARKQMRDPWES